MNSALRARRDECALVDSVAGMNNHRCADGDAFEDLRLQAIVVTDFGRGSGRFPRSAHPARPGYSEASTFHCRWVRARP